MHTRTPPNQRQGTAHEANLSAEQEQAQENARILGTYEQLKRPERHQTQNGKGPKEACRLTRPPPPTRHRASHDRSRKSSRNPEVAQPRRAGRAETALRTKHFTLYLVAPSTKKNQRLGFRLSARSGDAAARNRVKRHARELYRLTRHTLPNDKELVITSAQRIGRLTRCDIRKEVAQLFGRAALRLPVLPGEASGSSR
jgi:ribonuclease P protein component